MLRNDAMHGVLKGPPAENAVTHGAAHVVAPEREGGGGRGQGGGREGGRRKGGEVKLVVLVAAAVA